MDLNSGGDLVERESIMERLGGNHDVTNQCDRQH